ncbi:hypothetical protein [Rhizobium sp. L1K21]|uniref:hypothetical protein n=1 Tax=Rhizobium sp. L1K21 TaxID=2954933 RepID=UPI002092E956|nr:hypothetical protein [Rhizobium sp. L1K21]MCO6185761.1 hypothetical protein [Rhizobium sp. L1K21]
MRLIIAVLFSALCASQALAISRYETQSMTCGQIRTALDREGAAILRYPSEHTPGLTLYDRYVGRQNACGPHEVTQRTDVPAKDGSCPVLRCIDEPDRCDLFIMAPGCD